ncbi:hypothetical protein D1872_185790 [compost metagenome]
MSEHQHVIETLRTAKTFFIAQDKDGSGLALHPSDVLALVDSLQQQVAQLQEMSKLHTSGAKQLVQDLHTLRLDRDELRKALEEIASEEMMIGSTPVKMRLIARKALGE